MTCIPKEILIVDDEPEFRNLLQKRFRSTDYHVVMAKNAQEALVALWEKHLIGLVLLDVRLPSMNGLNIFEIIRKDFPDKKIIVCSALQKDEQRFLIDDAEEYFYKSEDLSSLLEKIDKLFNVKNTKGALRHNDKRGFRRLPVNVLASCESTSHGLTHHSMHFFSYTKDLSLHGGRFIVGENIQPGDHFLAALELPVNFLPLLIDCEVIWTRKLDEFESRSKSTEIGVKFVKLDRSLDEDKLKNYLCCV